MKHPRRSPAKRSSRSNRRSARVLHASISTAATLKRTARKINTEAWSSAFLTTTKVAPQSKEQKASARSALARLGISIRGNPSSGLGASLAAGVTVHKLHGDSLAAKPVDDWIGEPS